MEHIKKLAQWEIDRDEALRKKSHKSKWEHIGLKVRRKGRSKWEYGILGIFDLGDGDEYCINFDDGTSEQLIGLPFEQEKDGKWITKDLKVGDGDDAYYV